MEQYMLYSSCHSINNKIYVLYIGLGIEFLQNSFNIAIDFKFFIKNFWETKRTRSGIIHF